jgi:hypothetical protein
MTPSTAQPPIAEDTQGLLDSILDSSEKTKYARGILDQKLYRGLFAQDLNMAKVFYASGVFDDLKKLTPEQGVNLALTKIRIGQSWGMSEADAMQYIFFQNGKPDCMTAYIASRLKLAGWDWAVEELENGIRLWPKRLTEDGTYKPILDKDGKPASVKFDAEDAKRAGLDKKDTYKLYPMDMYFNRAIARLKRRYAPEVLAGAGAAGDVDISEYVEAPPPPQIAQATQSKTSALAEKIYSRGLQPAQQSQPQQAAPVAAEKPEPVAVITEGDLF